MKRILLIIMIIALSSCSNSDNWYIGTWEFDLDKTDKVSKNLNSDQKKLLDMYTSFDQGYKLTLNNDSIIIEYNGKVAPGRKYQLIKESDSQYKLDNEKMPIIVGRDDTGIYSLVRKEAKFKSGDKVLSNEITEVKVYLKPVN